MNYKGICDTQKLTDEILNKYDVENAPDYRESIRKKIVAICKNTPAVKNGKSTDLWNKTRFVPKGTNKAKHIFDEREKDLILNHHDMKEHILKNLSTNSKVLEQELKTELEKENELISAAKKHNKEMKKLNELPETDCEDYIEPEEDFSSLGFYSREEAHQEKLFMMIEALFLKQFTPIDEELLWNDMNVMPLLASTNDDFTPEMIEAIRRYENKDYFKPLVNERKEEIYKEEKKA